MSLREGDEELDLEPDLEPAPEHVTDESTRLKLPVFKFSCALFTLQLDLGQFGHTRTDSPGVEVGADGATDDEHVSDSGPQFVTDLTSSWTDHSSGSHAVPEFGFTREMFPPDEDRAG